MRLLQRVLDFHQFLEKITAQCFESVKNERVKFSKIWEWSIHRMIQKMFFANDCSRRNCYAHRNLHVEDHVMVKLFGRFKGKIRLWIHTRKSHIQRLKKPDKRRQTLKQNRISRRSSNFSDVAFFQKYLEPSPAIDYKSEKTNAQTT